MKLTKSKLKRIIQEELKKVLKEFGGGMGAGAPMDGVGGDPLADLQQITAEYQELMNAGMGPDELAGAVTDLDGRAAPILDAALAAEKAGGDPALSSALDAYYQIQNDVAGGLPRGQSMQERKRTTRRYRKK